MGSALSLGSTAHHAPPLPTHAVGDFSAALVDFVGWGDGRLHPRPPPHTPTPTVLPGPDRLVCIGDLHGDLPKTKQAFRLAGLVDEAGGWTGGNTVCVQVGDMLDRGGEEIRVMYFLEHLRYQASLAGGALHVINGNHETMNMYGRFTYATREGAAEFDRWVRAYNVCERVKQGCGDRHARPLAFDSSVKARMQSRAAALRPGGPISSRFLAPLNLVQVVGDSLFVHAGLRPEFVPFGMESAQAINDMARDWMTGAQRRVPSNVRGRDAVVWTRIFSQHDGGCDCALLEETLARVGLQRMVVGHSIFSEINSACDEQVFRIDVGMSKGCADGVPQVLEIRDGRARVMTAPQSPQPQQQSVRS